MEYQDKNNKDFIDNNLIQITTEKVRNTLLNKYLNYIEIKK